MSRQEPNVQDVQRFFQSFSEALGEVAAVYVRAMRSFFDSPAGQALAEAAKYYDEHPAELDALRRARDAEVRRQGCHCFCGKWGHLGTCTAYAETSRTFFAPSTGVVDVPLCGACAGDQDAKRSPAVIPVSENTGGRPQRGDGQ